MCYGCVSDEFLLVIGVGVFGAVEAQYFVWTSSVVAMDICLQLDSFSDEGEVIVYGEGAYGEHSLGCDLDGIGALVLDTSAVVGGSGFLDEDSGSK